MQTVQKDLTQKCSTMSPGNPFIFGSNGQRSRSRGAKRTVPAGFLHSCECWLLLVLLLATRASIAKHCEIKLYSEFDEWNIKCVFLNRK